MKKTLMLASALLLVGGFALAESPQGAGGATAPSDVSAADADGATIVKADFDLPGPEGKWGNGMRRPWQFGGPPSKGAHIVL